MLAVGDSPNVCMGDAPQPGHVCGDSPGSSVASGSPHDGQYDAPCDVEAAHAWQRTAVRGSGVPTGTRGP
jgi:hypothetical protein